MDNVNIGEMSEYLNIERMPQEWVNELIKPFVDQVRFLASELNSMIGHPENPFAEHILDENVKIAFETIQEEPPELTNWDEKY